jgi:hypothetical protein
MNMQEKESETSMPSRRQPSLLVFGDSHAVIWEGNNVLKRASQPKFSNIQVLHLGPALAFNLISLQNDGLGKWGNEIFSFMKKMETPPATAIMLCFGEIDIRTQVVKRAADSQSTIQSAVFEIVGRLNCFAEKLFYLTKAPILLWEPVATSGNKYFSYDSDFPAIGSEIERNFATIMFSNISREFCEKSRSKGMLIYSFGIAQHIMNFYETKPEFFEDGCHLNTSGLSIGIKSLKELCINNTLPSLHTLFENFKATNDRTNIRNIASLAKVTLSSTYSSPSVLTRTNLGWCFHTNKEDNPSALIDIGYAALIRSLVIFNRFDSYQERASTLQISAGLATDKLIEVFGKEKTWSEYKKPLTIEFPKNFGAIRFIFLKLNISEFFHLGEIQIFEDSFLI